MIFSNGLFWFLEGILFCFVLIGLRVWTQDKGIPMPFWKWALSILWLVFFGFTIAFVGTSLGEGEPQAATLGGIIFGLISIISFFTLWIVLGFNKKK